MNINTTTNTWSYGSAYEGDSSTHSLYVLPLYLFDSPQICPICLPIPREQEGPTSAPITQLWLQGGGRLLISDSQGRELGYVGSELINEIPGAGYSPILGGLNIDSEPLYTLPLTETYTILLDGQTLTQTTTAEIAQFGPGFATAAKSIVVTPSTSDYVVMAVDGTEITFQASGGKEVDLLLALDEEEASHQFTIAGADVSENDSATLSADLQDGVLSYGGAEVSGGSYSLALTRITADGRQEFAHAGLAILDSNTHYIQYGAWNGSGPIEVHIDHGSDGTVDEVITIENEFTTQLFLPVILKE